MTKTERISLLLATWFGSGFIRPVLLKSMAGTYGSLFALPLCWLAIEIGSTWIHILFCYVILYIGIYTIPFAEKFFGSRINWRDESRDRDQPQIVIDEVLGMLVTHFPLLFVQEVHWYHYAVAFALFRFFDIVKLWPASFFEEKVEDEYGVMYDDFFAGIHSAIVLQIFIWIMAIETFAWWHTHLLVIGGQMLGLIAYVIGSRKYYLSKDNFLRWLYIGIAIDLGIMCVGFMGILPHSATDVGVSWTNTFFLLHISTAGIGMFGFIGMVIFLLIKRGDHFRHAKLRKFQYQIFLPLWILGVSIAFLNFFLKATYGIYLYS